MNQPQRFSSGQGQAHRVTPSNSGIMPTPLGGPLVTLRVNNIPVKDVIRQVCAQAGITPRFIGTSPRFGRPLTLYAQSRPLWKVLRSIAMRSGVSPDREGVGPARMLKFNAAGWFGLVPMDIRGPFAVIIPSISRTTEGNGKLAGVSFAGRSQSILHVPMILLWCPNRGEFLSAANPVLLQAIDDKGESLVIPRTQAASVGGDDDLMFHYQATLLAPSGDAGYISIMRGTIPLMLAVTPRSYAVSDFGSGKSTVNAAGMHLVLGKPERLHGQWYVPLEIHAPITPVEQVFISALFDGGCITFRDAKGRKLRRLGIRSAGGDEIYRCELEIDDGKPTAARVSVYTRVLRYDLPFVFRNLPIPR